MSSTLLASWLKNEKKETPNMPSLVFFLPSFSILTLSQKQANALPQHHTHLLAQHSLSVTDLKVALVSGPRRLDLNVHRAHIITTTLHQPDVKWQPLLNRAVEPLHAAVTACHSTNTRHVSPMACHFPDCMV